MTITPKHGSPPEHELELSRSSTQESSKCKSCGTMFEISEHMEAGALICPVCRRREAARGNRLQSSDQGF
jgi:predicted RNA-binding Zn-ribbon protein involved in translation (DUF1610 family)